MTFDILDSENKFFIDEADTDRLFSYYWRSQRDI